MERFSRIKNKGYLCTFSLVALFMMVSVGRMLLHTSWDSTPGYITLFVILFLGVWFGLCIYAVWFGLTDFQSVEFRPDEIRLCMGPLVLRRIPTDRIKTVGLGAMYSRGSRPIQKVLLVLSSEDTETLNEKGKKCLKSGVICSRMREAGIAPEGKYAGARAYLFDHILGSGLWLEDTDETRATLRKYLTTAVFIL